MTNIETGKVVTRIGDKEDDDSHESSGSSPEAAGVARGAVKTATSVSRRAAIGRLPKPAAAHPTPAGIFPKKVPMKQVAKVSDRISTGFDAYDAASTSNVGDEKAWKKGQLEQIGRRAASFSGTLLKNTILGAGLFEAFERTIVFLDQKNHKAEHEGETIHKLSKRQDLGDAFSRTSIKQHFGAGMVGGSVHSLLLMAFQSGSFMRESGFNGLKIITASSFSSISAWNAASMLHHGLAHGLLFSSYEGTKRIFFSHHPLQLSSVSYLRRHNNEEKLENSMFDVVKIGFAGGIAGQIQHIASHYTEAWLLGAGEHRKNTYLKDIKNTKLFVPGPSFKSILISFPPSAIGFIAFEYGKILIE